MFWHGVSLRVLTCFEIKKNSGQKHTVLKLHYRYFVGRKISYYPLLFVLPRQFVGRKILSPTNTKAFCDCILRNVLQHKVKMDLLLMSRENFRISPSHFFHLRASCEISQGQFKLAISLFWVKCVPFRPGNATPLKRNFCDCLKK